MKEYDSEVMRSIRRNINKELEERIKEQSKIDRIKEDILHILEGSEKMNAVEFCMVAMALRKVLRIRRVLKKRRIVLESMLECLNEGGAKPEDIHKIGWKQENLMRGNVLKYYNLRFLKNKTDLKKYPVMAQVNDALERLNLKEYEDDYNRI